MQTQKIAHTPFEVSRIALGCLGLGGKWDYEPLEEATQAKAMLAVRTALDLGINLFDHADIYAFGKSEEAFSAVWRERSSLRSQVVLESKAGIILPGDRRGPPGRFDFSYAHITCTVEGSLKRLGTDYLDILLLHRPDPLVEPEEVARALDELHAAGKVRYFGLSNHTPWQIELLKKCVRQPFVVNQLEFNVVHSQLVDHGVVTNQDVPVAPVRGDGTLEYCRLHDITIQAWSPLARGFATGRSPDERTPAELNARYQQAGGVAAELARAKGVRAEAILTAWILRHPACILPIVGTTDPQRLAGCCQADGLDLTRQEWYRLFIAGRGAPMP